jgi:tetratricopeptide (TPR) repeat protein
MLAQRHMHLEWEIARWALIMALAAALAIVIGHQMARGDEPARLPPSIDQWAIPMETAPPAVTPAAPTEDAAMQLWTILEDQHAGRMDLAMVEWGRLTLPPESEVWRNVGLAQANLAMGEVATAEAALDKAAELAPDNAIVHYYLGILNLEKAWRAKDWYDPAAQPEGRLVSFGPTEVVPNTPDMYRLAAMGELELAVELADTVMLDEPLLSAEWPTSAALTPTVGDLLLATGANDFEAKAHNMLGYLHLENGAPEEAEQHMDAAADSHAIVVFAYEDLGKYYEEQGRSLDAFRAYAKLAGQGTGLVHPLGKMMENLRDAFTQP